MAKIDIISSLEKISFMFPNRLLKLEGYLLRENIKEFLEIIIYRGFSSSTTHQIEINSEKKVLNFDYFFSNCTLLKAPLSLRSEEIIRENTNPLFFLKKKNWN